MLKIAYANSKLYIHWYGVNNLYEEGINGAHLERKFYSLVRIVYKELSICLDLFLTKIMLV